MKGILAPQAKANTLVDQRNRWFAWGQANSIFNTLLWQRYYMPFSHYDPVNRSLVDGGTVGVLQTLINNAATLGMDGPVNYGSTPGTANDYFVIDSSLGDYTDCSYPVVAIWVRNRTADSTTRWWIDRLSGGMNNYSWGIGLTGANLVTFRLSANGVAVTDLQPGNPDDLTAWNFYAFQHRSATETNVLVNADVTTYNTGLATIFTGGACDLRIGWYGDSDAALVALANDNSANVVQKLLGLYYHSRYAFRDDWT